MDPIFLRAVCELPGPLLEALTDGELLDPGMLLTYPRTDPKPLGLDGSGLASTDEYCGDGGGSLVVDPGHVAVHTTVHSTKVSTQPTLPAPVWTEHTADDDSHHADVARTTTKTTPTQPTRTNA